MLEYIKGSTMANKNKNGYVLIMLLVVIAIGMMIYYADMMWIGGGQTVKQEKPEEQPWKDESLINDPNHPARAAKKPAVNSTKPIISTPLALKGAVASKDADRGQVVFIIQPNGTIDGNWQCQYSYTHSAYEIAAMFKGNTDTTQNAPDDVSKLYLVAKGEFVQKATNLDSGEVTETTGTAYFSGWLGSNLTASGTLSITTNKKWHADYTWTANTVK
jgi:hypothetical protein